MTLGLLALCSFVLIVDVTLLWIGRRSWERPTYPRCPKCFYDLRRSRLSCPECGHTAKESVDLFRRRKRPMLGAGIGLFVAAASIFLLWNIAEYCIEQHKLARLLDNRWVTVVHYESQCPQWLRSVLPPDINKYFKRVWHIGLEDDREGMGLHELDSFRRLRSLSPGRVTGADLVALGNMKHLRRLFLSGENIDDTVMYSIVDMKNLRRLDITGTAVTDDGLQQVRSLHNLTSLHIGYTAITDKGLRYLLDCERLGYVYLQNTATTEEGRNQLIQTMRSRRLN